MPKNRITYNEIAGQKIPRLEAISDGVFAFALTLLVLDIHVPIAETIRTEGDLVAALISLLPKFLTYFLSFMTLGIFWTGHTAQFNYIHKSDRHLNWLSLFFLLFVTVIPFSTAFLGEFIHFKVAIGFYWFNLFLLGFMLYIHWVYAYKNHLVAFEQGEDKAAINRAILLRILISQALYAMGALLCFIDNYLSISVIILIQLNWALALFFSGSRNRRS